VSERAERRLLVATPVAAIAAVALGLRLGAAGAVRAAVVYGAPAAGAGTGLAWQVVTFDEDHGARQPVALPDVEVVARAAGGAQARWRGATNEDGVGEVQLALAAAAAAERLHLDVRAGGRLLASGDVSPPPAPRPKAPQSPWARFARRDGDVALDVAVLGQRAAPGFAATVWVRARDAATRAPVAGAVIEPESDSSFVPAASGVQTDARGWAQLVVTPVGFSVPMVLHARAAGGRAGTWAGGLFVSPGAAQIVLPARVPPDEPPTIELTMPSMRTTAYVEIDDARGRAWAAAVPLVAAAGGMPHATVRAPVLAAGLYWAVAAGDPAGAARLGPATAARPFFVAATDDAALAFGTDPDECAPPADAREAARAVSVCLALATPTPIERWTALDGLSMQHARDAQRRARGLQVSLGAILVAVPLEALLLLRAATRARARLRAVAQSGEAMAEHDAAPPRLVGRAWTVAVALLVALLGFALLAAFLLRVA
jgi:hypothetical protein